MGTYLRNSISRAVLLTLLFFIGGTQLQAQVVQPEIVPIGSFPDIFTYYDPLNPNTPPGADTVSKSIIDLQNPISSSTAFLIRTFRDDDIVCMCLTGHQISGLFANGAQPITGSTVYFNADIYMNYLGKDSASQNQGTTRYLNKTKPGAFKGRLSTGRLQAYYHNQPGSAGRDIALVLVNKRMLPGSFATLGYDFDDAGWSNDQYYAIGHPNSYPQRIQSGYHFVNQGSLFTVLVNALPPGYATGPGGSGSPVLKRPLPLSPSWYLRGVASKYLNEDSVSDYDGRYLHYSETIQFTKIGVIENAIRKHCWKQSDSANISASGSYKQTVLVDNTAAVAAFNQDRAVSSTSGLVSNAGTFTEQLVGYGQQAAANIVSSYLRGKAIGALNFPLANKYPSAPYANYDWIISIVGKIVEATAGFQYTASGQSELHLASAVVEPVTTSTARQGGNTGSDTQQPAAPADAGFSIYPNPSADGVFYLSFPETAAGSRIAVYSSDGRRVHEAVITGTGSYRVALSGLPKGAYVWSVYGQHTGKKLFSKTIIY